MSVSDGWGEWTEHKSGGERLVTKLLLRLTSPIVGWWQALWSQNGEPLTVGWARTQDGHTHVYVWRD